MHRGRTSRTTIDLDDERVRGPSQISRRPQTRRDGLDIPALAVRPTWPASGPGVLRLPSGRAVRGRALRRPCPGGASPQLGLYLLHRPPEPQPWETRWLRWRDFGLPSDDDADIVLREVWHRAAQERVEIACAGGRGRTGTALACLAVLDGVPARQAVDFVRAHYDERAVETPWQRRYVARFPV